VIIKTREGNIFGAYLSHGWNFGLEKKKDSFFGNGECFVFTLHPKVTQYKWKKGNKDYFMRSDQDFLVIGGGGEGVAIFLDSELWWGRSKQCSTFNNEPLNGESGSFECMILEAFTFKKGRL